MELRFARSFVTSVIVLLRLQGGGSGVGIAPPAEMVQPTASRATPRASQDTIDELQKQQIRQLLAKGDETLDSVLSARGGLVVIGVRSVAQSAFVRLLRLHGNDFRTLAESIPLHVEDEYPDVKWAPARSATPLAVMLIWAADGEWPTFAQVLGGSVEHWSETWRTRVTGCIAPRWKQGQRGSLAFVEFSEQLTDDCFNTCYEQAQSVTVVPLAWPITRELVEGGWRVAAPEQMEYAQLARDYSTALRSVREWSSAECSSTATLLLERLTAWRSRALAAAP